jgi:uncharacterized protein YlxW (UPF0749 family)
MPEPTERLDTPQPPDPVAGRRRLLQALTKPTRQQAVVALLLCALGFASVVQVRESAGADAYAGLRDSELIEVLDGLTGTAQRARGEIERLEETRDELQSETSARTAALEEAQQRKQVLGIMAGLVKVTGPGLRVTITPGADSVSVGSLLDTVQELRTAGAEAIEFNDQIRVVAQSHFNSSAGVITLDGHDLQAPYVIDVIGDPHVLKTALTFADGPVETLELRDGATVSIEEPTAVDIDSVRDQAQTEHLSAQVGE